MLLEFFVKFLFNINELYKQIDEATNEVYTVFYWIVSWNKIKQLPATPLKLKSYEHFFGYTIKRRQTNEPHDLSDKKISHHLEMKLTVEI